MNGRRRVMLVDDSQSIRVEAKRFLESEFEVLACEDGMDAIGRLSAFNPEVILLDIVMPKINGYEALSIIRLNPVFAKTPIYMMSGKGGVFDIAQGRILGFNGHITKPFKPDSLMNLVRHGLGLEPLAAAQE